MNLTSLAHGSLCCEDCVHFQNKKCPFHSLVTPFVPRMMRRSETTSQVACQVVLCCESIIIAIVPLIIDLLFWFAFLGGRVYGMIPTSPFTESIEEMWRVTRSYMQELWGLCSVKNLRDIVFAIWYLDLF